jgi:uncharacterized protein YbjQ (UPF0145 family)
MSTNKGILMDTTMLIATQDHLEDYKILKTFGLVRGTTVRSRNVARNFIAGLRTLMGGEIPEFTKAIAESREQAIDRMIEHAKEFGADAIVGVRFITAEVGQTCSEIMVYGTAVKLQK